MNTPRQLYVTKRNILFTLCLKKKIKDNDIFAL